MAGTSGFDYQLMNMMKEQARSAAIGVIQHQNEQFNAVPVNTVKDRLEHRPVKHRESTLIKQEQVAFFGKFDPANGICPTCHMTLAKNGACAGLCFD
jgi:hypothetical protein